MRSSAHKLSTFYGKQLRKWKSLRVEMIKCVRRKWKLPDKVNKGITLEK
jgi:hypothetical protein